MCKILCVTPLLRSCRIQKKIPYIPEYAHFRQNIGHKKWHKKNDDFFWAKNCHFWQIKTPTALFKTLWKIAHISSSKKWPFFFCLKKITVFKVKYQCHFFVPGILVKTKSTTHTHTSLFRLKKNMYFIFYRFYFFLQKWKTFSHFFFYLRKQTSIFFCIFTKIAKNC